MVSVRKHYRTTIGQFYFQLVLFSTEYIVLWKVPNKGIFSNNLFGVKYLISRDDDRKDVIRDLHRAVLPLCIHSCGTVQRACGAILKQKKK